MKTSAPGMASVEPAGATGPVGRRGDRGEVGVQTRAAGMDDPVDVDRDDVTGAAVLQQPDDRAARRPDPGDDDAAVGEVLADDREGVAEGGEDADGRAVLVVVEDGDVQLVAQPPLDLEAPGAEMSSRLIPP